MPKYYATHKNVNYLFFNYFFPQNTINYIVLNTCACSGKIADYIMVGQCTNTVINCTMHTVQYLLQIHQNQPSHHHLPEKFSYKYN